jgi:hypothetical protein
VSSYEAFALAQNDSSRSFTSYAHCTLAKAHARRGYSDWHEQTKGHLELARQKMAAESPFSTWYESTKRETRGLEARVFVKGDGSDDDGDASEAFASMMAQVLAKKMQGNGGDGLEGLEELLAKLGGRSGKRQAEEDS